MAKLTEVSPGVFYDLTAFRESYVTPVGCNCGSLEGVDFGIPDKDLEYRSVSPVATQHSAAPGKLEIKSSS